MFVFTSGKTKVAGCTSNNQIENAMRLLMNCLSKHLGDEIPDYLGVKSNIPLQQNKINLHGNQLVNLSNFSLLLCSTSSLML